MKEQDIFRDLSTAFSRKVFEDILKFYDYSRLDRLIAKHNLKGKNYLEVIERVYNVISEFYRNEYVVKNELLTHLVKRHRNAVVFSEFRVGKSIADMVLFTEESIAFEIKTEYDTPRRLNKQLCDYKRLFDKCYVVVPESKVGEYSPLIDPTTGILAVSRDNITKVRNSVATEVDLSGIAPCLHYNELRNIALATGCQLNGMSGFDLFDFCDNAIRQTNEKHVSSLFVQEVKKRKNNTGIILSYPLPIRQTLLSLKLQKVKADKLLYLLKQPIEIK